MPRRKIPYKEGDFFSVPLRTSGFGLGIAARITGKGGILGYFFAQKYLSPPALSEISGKTSGDAIFICHLGDLGFFEGGWRIVGTPDTWCRDKWPQPSFVRTDVITKKHFRVTYPENDFFSEIERIEITDEEAALLPSDGTWGYGAVEKRLTKILEGVAIR